MLFINQQASYAGSTRNTLVKPYAMSAWALFIIGITRTRRVGAGDVGGNTAASSGYSLGWNETVTDINGTHDQVEFAIYTPSNSTLVSQSEFQIADGQAQNIRLVSATINGVNVTVLAYGDNTGTHVVEFNQTNGAILQSFVDPTTTIFSQLTAMGKDERAISVSGYVYRGNVKYTDDAFNKTVVYKGKRGIILLNRSRIFESATRTTSAKTIFWIRFAMELQFPLEMRRAFRFESTR